MLSLRRGANLIKFKHNTLNLKFENFIDANGTISNGCCMVCPCRMSPCGKNAEIFHLRWHVDKYLLNLCSRVYDLQQHLCHSFCLLIFVICKNYAIILYKIPKGEAGCR